tara:strand:+ start:16213 stop:17811 length:1599 start_codon:yes stop_codon:yes gene_type:complete
VLNLANVTMQFSSKPLFENISAKFGNGNRYGLIGANGCGKSTLMKIMSGKLTASSGNVSLNPPQQRIGTLNQDQYAFDAFTVIDAVIMGHKDLWEVKAERERIYAKEDMTEEEGILVCELEAQFAEMDGYTAESRAGELLMSAGIEEEHHWRLMGDIPPGWKLRVLLVQALFSNPDILLLDEPTNNLDIASIGWLEEQLIKCQSTMVIISHDRHFLNSVCTHIADIDFGELRVYPGNYDDFMTASELAKEQVQNENAKKKAQMADLQAFVSRFSANASKAKQATSRQKQLDKIQLEEVKPSSRVSPFIRFNQDKKLYRQALTFEKLGQGYEEGLLFDKGNLLLEAGSRLAIIGENGAGKTTLIKTLMGDLEPKNGEIKWAENASISYCPQDSSDWFKPGITVFDWISQFRPEKEDDQYVRGILGRLLFKQDDYNKEARVCSGGEKNRLIFGRIMMDSPNVIVMDEPTNHMDMEAIEALNLALTHYEGTLIFVSHDREFVSSLATHIIEIKNNRLNAFAGTYEEYLDHVKSQS